MSQMLRLVGVGGACTITPFLLLRSTLLKHPKPHHMHPTLTDAGLEEGADQPPRPGGLSGLLPMSRSPRLKAGGPSCSDCTNLGLFPVVGDHHPASPWRVI